MQQTKRYLTCAETAKLVRKALKAEFPGAKFSVRSSTYAGGASIDVRWTDGPAAPRVDAVLCLYQGASFDGMIDLQSYHDSFLTGDDGTPELVSFGADFVHGQREISSEWYAEIAAEFERLTDIPCDLSPRGAGWTTRYPLYVDLDGELLRMVDGETEYGNTLVHRYTHGRDR